jgi:tetratricopeptide (TPR) repeat protein
VPLLDFDRTGGFPGGIALSRPEKREPSVDLRRRNFLKRCCQGASASLISTTLRSRAFPQVFRFDSRSALFAAGELHLHPHYRSQRPLDARLLKVKAGLDNFATEKYADQIIDVLRGWSSNLLRSPREVTALDEFLTQDFSGTSPQHFEERLVRPGTVLEVYRREFATQPTIEKGAFLGELRAALSAFEKLLTADFQVTSIDAGTSPSSSSDTPSRLRTHIRYELVGTGVDFYREQRVGEWQIEWVPSDAAEFRVRRWQFGAETRSRSANPVYIDIAAQCLGSNPSYASQLLRGADYWRTVLDGACGIDIYGHNGVSVADIDNDGFDDLYVCQPAGLPNRLYRNRGDGTFEDITATSGLGILENTACALFADVDNDGRQDLIVVRTNGPLLFLNDGGGKFTQKPNAFQFSTPPQGTFTGAALADSDRDGWLDIYFCLYAYYQGTDQYKYPLPYHDAQNGPPNFLMRNQRDGTFRDVTAESGLNQNNTRYSFCCGWSDFNRDEWPDLYVVNDFGRKNLYRNNGDGTFTDIAPQAGVEDTGAGMSVCWFDYDNDGAGDLYVANMWTAAGQRISSQEVFEEGAPETVRSLYRKHAMGNSLFRNGGDSRFHDESSAAGVQMGRWSWSSDAWDFDHDGYADLYVTNGMVSGPSQDDLNSFFWRQVVAKSPQDATPSAEYEEGWNAINELIRGDGTWSGYERNVFYANNRDGTFSDVSGAVGLDFLEDGRSFALCDFDHDGRLEVFLKNRNGPQLRILRNVLPDLGPSLAFRLRGTKSNRDAIGAVVTVQTELTSQTRSLQAGSGFLSQHSKDVFFGLGGAKDSVRACIRWPSGLVQELRDLPINHRVWVEEGSTQFRAEAFREAKAWSKPATSDPVTPEALPICAETWLLAPVTAPDFTQPDLTGHAHPLAALLGEPAILNFWSGKSADCMEQLKAFNRVHEHWANQGLRILTINVDEPGAIESIRAATSESPFSFPILRGSDDVAATYNILYRYLFDRHRDLTLPTTFLINGTGEIVKVYQGPARPERVEQDFHQIPSTPAERLAKALPFPGVIETAGFTRNYLSLGSGFYQSGYMGPAEASFQRALRENPDSAEAAYGLGSVYLKQEETAKARQTFEQAIKLHSSYPGTLPNAWNNLGLLATREGKYAEAVQNFQEALRLSPDHLVALTNLGNAYRQQKQWEEARKALDRATVVDPQDPEANYSLGMVYAQLNDSDRAYDYLQKALRFRPLYPEALNNLGVLYLRTQRRDQAVATFEECIRVAPTFDQSYLNLARVYALEGAPDKARTVLLQLLKQHPDHPQARRALAELPQ